MVVGSNPTCPIFTLILMEFLFTVYLVADTYDLKEYPDIDAAFLTREQAERYMTMRANPYHRIYEVDVSSLVTVTGH